MIIIVFFLSYSRHDKKTLFFAVLTFVITSAKGQEVMYNLPKPLQWGTEKFTFPLDFAPGIPLKGTEELRFAPGWSNKKSSEYWAYTFLWFIKGKPQLDKDTINSYLKQYYDGLYVSNLKDKSKAHPNDFTTADLKNVSPLANDQETYEGKIMTLDFLTGEQITFNARIHVRNLPQIGRSAILIEISPETYKQPVWVQMNTIVAGFAVTENNEN